MKVLAVDQSYTSSGIILLDKGKLSHAEIFSSDPDDDTFTRAWNVAKYIRSVANLHNPEYIVLEGLAFSKFGNATRDLAGLQYMIVCVLQFLEGYELIIVSPNTVKKVATGKGNSKKEQLLEALPKTVHQKFLAIGAKKTKGLYDLSDAYWIGQTGLLEIQKRTEHADK